MMLKQILSNLTVGELKRMGFVESDFKGLLEYELTSDFSSPTLFYNIVDRPADPYREYFIMVDDNSVLIKDRFLILESPVMSSFKVPEEDFLIKFFNKHV